MSGEGGNSDSQNYALSESPGSAWVVERGVGMGIHIDKCITTIFIR